MLTEIQKALHQAQGRSFKTMSSLSSARPTRTSFTNTTVDPCTDGSRGYIQTDTVPQCAITSDLGVTVALAANNTIMEAGICPDLGAHTAVNVDSCIPDAGTDDAT